MQALAYGTISRLHDTADRRHEAVENRNAAVSLEILILLAILVFTVAAFVFEWMPIDLVALSCLALLLITGLVTPDEASPASAIQP